MSSPLNILVDARPLVDSNAGGVARVTHQALASLIASTDDVQYFFATTGAKKPALPEPFASSDSVTHLHIPFPNKLWSALCIFSLAALDREAARRAKAMFHAALLPNIGFTGRLRIPYALILHDLSFLIEPRWFTPRMRLWHLAVNAKQQITRASRLFCVSETTARDAERLLGVPRDRLEVFNPGVSNFDTASGHVLPQRLAKPFVLALNESNPRKNIATAITAVAKLREDPEFSDLQLVIVDGKKKFRHSLLLSSRANPTKSGEPRNEFRNSDRVHRLNDVSDADLADLYRDASALLYPSWYEGFGLPLHEAARFGTPCLASSAGALPETAPEGTLFIPTAKPHLWASALRSVLRHPEQHRTAFNWSMEQPDVSGLIQWLRGKKAGLDCRGLTAALDLKGIFL